MNCGMLQDSLLVIQQDWRILFVVLFFIAWGTLIVRAFLHFTAVTDDEAGVLSLALGGWPIPLLLLAIVFQVLRLLLSVQAAVLLTMAFILGTAFLCVWNLGRSFYLQSMWVLLLAAAFIFVRLGFAADLLLPPYFDSSTHYGIIRSLMESGRWVWPAGAYYHIGYHLTLAMISLFGGLDLSRVMLIFGQVVLALLPFPLYFFVQRLAGSRPAAWFAVLLSAFGWYMPAFSVNWGKYPALLSLLGIQFTLSLLLLKQVRWFSLALAATFLIHTRSVIVIPLFVLSWILADRLRPSKWHAVLLILGLGGMLVFARQGLDVVYKPYIALPSLLTLLLVVTQWKVFPRSLFFGGWLVLGISLLTQMPIVNSTPLLDRPLAEMLLYLPFAYLGGVGAAHKPWIFLIAAALLVAGHAGLKYDFSPSTCCQLAGTQDRAALTWIDETLGADAKVAVANADLAIDSAGMVMSGAGVDAGFWIAPLTTRAVMPLSYQTDFRYQLVRDALCAGKTSHIYVGSRPQSFRIELISEKADWYYPVFERDGTVIFQVIGCEGQ